MRRVRRSTMRVYLERRGCRETWVPHWDSWVSRAWDRARESRLPAGMVMTVASIAEVEQRTDETVRVVLQSSEFGNLSVRGGGAGVQVVRASGADGRDDAPHLGVGQTRGSQLGGRPPASDRAFLHSNRFQSWRSKDHVRCHGSWEAGLVAQPDGRRQSRWGDRIQTRTRPCSGRH